MRDFSWKYFTLTGDVESFMLYKEMDQRNVTNDAGALDGLDEDNEIMDSDTK